MLSPTAIKLRQQLAASLMPNTQQYTHPLQVFGDMAKTYASALMQSKLMDQYDANKAKANQALASILQGKEVSQTVPVPMYNQPSQMSDVSDPGLLAQTLQGKTGGSVATFPAGTSFNNQPTQSDLDLYAETAAGDYAPNVDVTVKGRVPYSKTEMAQKILGDPALMEYSPDLASTLLGQAMAPKSYEFVTAGDKVYVGDKSSGTIEQAGGPDDKFFKNPNERATFTNKVVDDWAKSQEAVRQVVRGVSLFEKLIEQGDTGPAQIAAIYNYFTALDPGGRVTGGEVDLSAAGRSLLEQLKSKVESVDKSQVLTRKEMIQMYDILKNVAQYEVEDSKRRYGDYAGRLSRVGTAKDDVTALLEPYKYDFSGRDFSTRGLMRQDIMSATDRDVLVDLAAKVEAMPEGTDKAVLRDMVEQRRLALGFE